MIDTPDNYASAPAPLHHRVSVGLAMLGEPELAGIISAAGLAAVYEQLAQTRHALTRGVDAELAIGLQIAHLTDEARRWKRRWAGSVAQARKEHRTADELRADNERLRTELADYQLADSERQGSAARAATRTQAGRP